MDNFYDNLFTGLEYLLNYASVRFGEKKVYDWLRAWMDEGDYIPAERIIDVELFNDQN